MRRVQRYREPYEARLSDVEILRDGETAVIRYRRGRYPTFYITLGPDLADMDDDAVLAVHNELLRSQRAMRALPIWEVPPGRPQIRRDPGSGRFDVRGQVLRVVLGDQGEIGPDVCIDHRVLSWEEFGALLNPFSGWGARLLFVHEYDITKNPVIIVGEPDDDTP
jgi:hypothetical protein